jgi:hypothetical protein
LYDILILRKEKKEDKMDKYKKNLKVEGDKIYSYNTLVARIERDYITGQGHVVVLGYYSQTTSKHINYVAKEKGLAVVKGY